MSTGLIGLITGFIGGIFAKSNADKSNELKHVTEERKKWRDDLRILIPKFLSLRHNENDNKSINTKHIIAHEIYYKVKLRLNPTDKEDIIILNKMKEYLEIITSHTLLTDKAKVLENEISDQFAILLKYEWEKAKNEAKSKSIFSLLNLIFVIIIINLSINFYFDINCINCCICCDCYITLIKCFICKLILILFSYWFLIFASKYIKYYIESKNKRWVNFFFEEYPFLRKIFKLNIRTRFEELKKSKTNNEI